MSVGELSPRLLDANGAVRDRVFGFETEYAAIAAAPDEYIAAVMREIRADPARSAFLGSRENVAYWENHDLLLSIFHHAMLRFGGQYTKRGVREYIDIGDHPERAGPEHVDFMDGAHDLLAGHAEIADKIGASAAALAKAGRAIKAVELFANTCNPGAYDENSWSSHMNLLASRQLGVEQYVLPLATFNATRIVWSGAGTVYRKGNGGYKPGLSEKASFIWAVANNNTIQDRPLVNLRDEPLADPERYRRIHDVSGETIFSPLANALRPAMGSLLLRAIEVGESFEDLLLENPVNAMRRISEDITLQRTYRLLNGGSMRAVEIQQAMIERALEVSTAAGNITSQEQTYAQRMLARLDFLQSDPMANGNWVDWVIKHKSIDRDLGGNPRRNGESDFAIAAQKSAHYHRLLPGEGTGMRMVRRKIFVDSPDESVLKQGVAVPPTRARLRGYLVDALRERGLRYRPIVGESPPDHDGYNDSSGGGWTGIEVLANGKVFRMPDPYESDTSRADEFLDRLAA